MYFLVSSEWADVGTEPTITNSRSPTPRRIDLMLANRAFLSISDGYSLAWETGLPSHAVQFVSIAGATPPVYPSWQSPPCHAPPPPASLPITPEEAWMAVPTDLIARVRALVASNQV
jgi:hypothetical protein